MSVYRTAPEAEHVVPPAPSRTRTPILIGVSALLHVALLGASAMMQPKPPPAPREVDVLKWEAVQLDTGETAWRSAGVQKARVRGEAATP